MATRTLRSRPQVMPAVGGSITTASVTLPETLPDSFDILTQHTLALALGQSDPDLEWRYSYVHGDQLGPGAEFWKGRTAAEEVDILPLLVQDDQLTPAMRREVDSQFAKDPEWDAIRDGQIIDAEDELVKVMTDWHDEAGLTAQAKLAAEHRWWAGLMIGRVYIPDAYAERLLNPGRQPKTLEEALELVHVQAIDPREGGPVIDQHQRVLGYFYRYERTTDTAGKTDKIIEVHTPSEVVTLIEVGGKLQVDGEPQPSPYASTTQRARRAGYLMWHAAREGGSTITPSLRDSQDSLNAVKTYWRRNDDQTGYRQLVVSNAEQPKNKQGQPVPFQMGPGVVIALRGLPVIPERTAEGAKPARLDPRWEVIPPLNPKDYHIPSSDGWKTDILEKCDQLWTLSPETQVSGESKRQSRKPFDRRVAFAGQDMGGFIGWALRSAMLLAAQVLGQVEAYADVTFKPKVYLDIDAVNLEELRLKLAMRQSGDLTLVSLLESTPGIPDAAKEAEAIRAEQAAKPVNTANEEALKKLLEPDTGAAGDA